MAAAALVVAAAAAAAAGVLGQLARQPIRLDSLEAPELTSPDTFS